MFKRSGYPGFPLFLGNPLALLPLERHAQNRNNLTGHKYIFAKIYKRMVLSLLSQYEIHFLYYPKLSFEIACTVGTVNNN